jgi:hypothetical protein
MSGFSSLMIAATVVMLIRAIYRIFVRRRDDKLETGPEEK